MKKDELKIPEGPFGFLILASKPYKLQAFLSVVFVVLASAQLSVVPFVYKRIIESINGVSGFGPENVPFWALAYVALGFISGVMWRMSGFTGLKWSVGVRKNTREMLTEYVTLHSNNYFSNRFAGAIATKIGQTSGGVKAMVDGLLWQWLEFFIQFLISLFLVFYTNTNIGWIFISWVLIITPINIWLFKKKIPLGKATTRAESDLNAHTVDLLTNMNASRDYARRKFELGLMEKLIGKRYITELKNWQFSQKVVLLNIFTETLFAGLMIYSAVYFWSTGLLGAGDVILTIALIASIRKSISSLGQQFNSFADNLSTIQESLVDILNEHEIKDVIGAKELRVTLGEVSFEQVSFSYGEREIFSKLNLKIKPGERVGLIGRSGAGKSTIVKLLTRQHDLSQGQILLDNQDIARVKQESLRGSIAVVPQEPLLFHRSIKENIGYGDLLATDEQIAEAAGHAQAREFIEKLPNKYHTLVGERGVRLSGGERQRIAIARAFLKNSRVLLLDEATSSLDSESESLIQEALIDLMKGKTVIAIAHRLSTLQAMDRLVVMDKGQIVEDGTHEELIKKGGIYADLWAHQAGGFIKED